MKNLKHFGKRGLAMFVALVLCLGLLPATAFAATEQSTISQSAFKGFNDGYSVGQYGDPQGWSVDLNPTIYLRDTTLVDRGVIKVWESSVSWNVTTPIADSFKVYFDGSQSLTRGHRYAYGDDSATYAYFTVDWSGKELIFTFEPGPDKTNQEKVIPLTVSYKYYGDKLNGNLPANIYFNYYINNLNGFSSCTHDDVTYNDNGNGTHDGVCDGCGQTVVDDEAHHYVDGVCDKCGAQDPNAAEEYTYEVEYCANDGHIVTNLPENTVETSTEKIHAVTLSSRVPVRDGYNFAGWRYVTSTIPAGGQLTLYMGEEEVELWVPVYAQWVCDGNHVDNDGDGTCDKDGCNEHVTSCDHAQTPHHCDHDSTVCGNDNCKGPDCVDKDKDGNCDICGKPMSPEEKTFTVTFCANGGLFADGSEHVYVRDVKDGATVSAPAGNPTRAGFAFKGWKDFNPAAPITGNVEYYAEWISVDAPRINAVHALFNTNTEDLKAGYPVPVYISLTNDGNTDLKGLILQETLDVNLTLVGTPTVLVNGAPVALSVNKNTEADGRVSNFWIQDPNFTLPKGQTLLIAYNTKLTDAGKAAVDALPEGQSLPLRNTLQFKLGALQSGGPNVSMNGKESGAVAANAGHSTFKSFMARGVFAASGPDWGEGGAPGGDDLIIVVPGGNGGSNPPHTHSYTWAPGTPATCTSPATEVGTCSCGDTQTRTTGEALGHSFGAATGDTATCLAGGHATQTCVRCGVTQQVPTNALGHVWGAWVVDTPATATTPGAQHRTCVRGCVENGTIPATGVTPPPVNPNPVNPNPVNPDPVDPVTEIDEPNVPLASANGLNDADHIAYINGYDEDHVRPEANITRAEVATIFYRLMTEPYRAANWADTNDFTDVAGHWANTAISTCAQAGIVNGYGDGSFAPDKYITRAEFAKVIVAFLDTEEFNGEGVTLPSDCTGHWSANNILYTLDAGWFTGDESGFRPEDYISRAEVMTVVNRMLNRICEEPDMLPEMKKWADNPSSAWYYEAVQEATNSHEYDRNDKAEELNEKWTSLLKNPDWAALEKDWAQG